MIFVDEQKIDLRIIKTKRLLYETLEDLMKNQAFEEIKVSDICTHAMINRSTFYAHYADKYELLAAYINDLKNSLASELEKNQRIQNSKEYYLEMIKLLLDHIEQKKETYASIMIHNRNSITIDILYDVIHKDIMKQIKESKESKIDTIPSDIISKFYLGAVFNVCLEWLKHDNQYSKQDIIHYIDLLIPNEFYQASKKDLN